MSLVSCVRAALAPKTAQFWPSMAQGTGREYYATQVGTRTLIDDNSNFLDVIVIQATAA